MGYYLADLHVHTALSACASREMVPPAIVSRCLEAGLSVIAIVDHNSAQNARSVITAAEGRGLLVLAGIEAQTCEDIHIVLLFPTCEAAEEFELSIIRPALPQKENRPDVFGRQYVLDARGEVIREERNMLSSSLMLSARQLRALANNFDALYIAAHAERPMHGYLYTLGLVDPEALPDCFEFGSKKMAESAAERWQLMGRASIVCSDAHSLSQIVPGRTAISVEALDYEHIKQALLSGNKEKVVVLEDTVE